MLFRCSCVFITLLYLQSCNLNHKRLKNRQNKSIKGYWILKNQKVINYPSLEFKKDSLAIFFSRGDTIYRFKYFVKGSYLTLTNNFNSEKESYEIIQLDNDNLIFASLREKKEKQHYKRKR